MESSPKMPVYVLKDVTTGKIISIKAGPKGLRVKRRSKRENRNPGTGNAELPVDQPQNPYGLPQYIYDRLPSQNVIIGGCVLAVSASIIIVLFRLDKTIHECIGEFKQQMITSSENLNRFIVESGQQVVVASDRISQVCDSVSKGVEDAVVTFEKMEQNSHSLMSKLCDKICDNVLEICDNVPELLGENIMKNALALVDVFTPISAKVVAWC